MTEMIEADFVVVGAGSAGCVMAARLSEDPATRVVLLEAGGQDDNRWIHIPLGFGKTFADPSVNWCYETEPDPGANGRRIFWPRGKVLGGSSSINGMVYIRGQHEDFDLWRQMGCTGWSATDVLPYFKRAEHQVRGADDWHGSGGPLVVSDVPDKHEICQAFIRACNDLGYPDNPDFNGATQDGVGYHQTTTTNGKRCSTAKGYLHPVMDRPNLRVITGALAQRISFAGQARDRRRFRPGQPALLRPRTPRGDPVRRRDQLAAASAAVRRRTAGTACRARHRRGAPFCPASARRCRTTTRRRSS
jgi:choline dehydrogenase